VLVGLSVLLLAVGIGVVGWMSGVGVGAADDPITANATQTLGDGERYYPSNESAKIVTSRSGGGTPTRTETVSLGELVQRECQEAGARRMQALLEARYPEPRSYFATGTPGDYVRVTALYNPLAHPNYYQIERALPDRVRVTVTLAFRDQTETCVVPISVEGTLTTPSLV
jgi:hypothetical protein